MKVQATEQTEQAKRWCEACKDRQGCGHCCRPVDWAGLGLLGWSMYVMNIEKCPQRSDNLLAMQQRLRLRWPRRLLHHNAFRLALLGYESKFQLQFQHPSVLSIAWWLSGYSWLVVASCMAGGVDKAKRELQQLLENYKVHWRTLEAGPAWLVCACWPSWFEVSEAGISVSVDCWPLFMFMCFNELKI